MRLLINILTIVVLTFFLNNAWAQELKAKINKNEGKIELYQGDKAVTTNYKVDKLEIEIFDATGEYSGSLELSSFILPKEEFEADEKVQIAKMEVIVIASGEKKIIDFK